MSANENLAYAAKQLSSLLSAGNPEPDELFEAMEQFEKLAANSPQSEVFGEIRRALAVGHWPLDDLAALVGSWGDTLDDKKVLEYLKAGPDVFRKVYSDTH